MYILKIWISTPWEIKTSKDVLYFILSVFYIWFEWGIWLRDGSCLVPLIYWCIFDMRTMASRNYLDLPPFMGNYFCACVVQCVVHFEHIGGYYFWPSLVYLVSHVLPWYRKSTEHTWENIKIFCQPDIRLVLCKFCLPHLHWDRQNLVEQSFCQIIVPFWNR